MDKAIILRYAEIHLKGNNRGYFENTLIENIKKALKDFRYEFQKTHGRYVISGFHENDETYIVSSLEKVFGIHSLSVCYVVDSNIDDIADAAAELGVTSGTFKVECNRADKTFPMKSYETAAELGGRMLDRFADLKVDIHNPDNIIYIDIREKSTWYVS